MEKGGLDPRIPKGIVAVKISIQKAQIDQIASLQEIELKCATIFPEKDLPEPLRSSPTDKQLYKEAIHEGLLWVLIENQVRPIGFILCKMLDSHLHIKEMNVHPSFARRDLGTKLLQHAFCYAEQSNIPALSLTTFIHLPWNGPFYERLGFQELAPETLSVGLAEILATEKTLGLKNRVVMYKVLKM
jgi:GNAT superfamily N-acetyltransferase